jgi:hypothetical protein
MTSAGEVLGVGVECGAQKDVAGRGDAATDHDDPWVEDGGELSHTEPEPLTDLVEDLQRGDVSRVSGLCDHGTSNAFGTPTGAVQQIVGQHRRGLGDLAGAADKSRTARVPLEAALESARAGPPSRHHHHMADLGGRPELAAQHAPVLDDTTTHARPHRQGQHVPVTSAGAETSLGPGSGVGVVLHHDAQTCALLYLFSEGLVAPGQVRGEHDGGAGGVDEARSGDPDRDRVVLSVQFADDVDDRASHLVGILGRRGPVGLGYDTTVTVDHACRDLRAPDVYPDRQRVHDHTPC